MTRPKSTGGIRTSIPPMTSQIALLRSRHRGLSHRRYQNLPPGWRNWQKRQTWDSKKRALTAFHSVACSEDIFLEMSELRLEMLINPRVDKNSCKYNKSSTQPEAVRGTTNLHVMKLVRHQGKSGNGFPSLYSAMCGMRYTSRMCVSRAHVWPKTGTRKSDQSSGNW